jgi:hypothetical protein
MTLSSQDHVYFRLLELGAFDRRAHGGWRFGTKVISDAVVERLIASGRATREDDHVRLIRSDARNNSPQSSAGA